LPLGSSSTCSGKRTSAWDAENARKASDEHDNDGDKVLGWTRQLEDKPV